MWQNRIDKFMQVFIWCLIIYLAGAAFFGIADWLGTYSVVLSMFWGVIVGSILAFLFVNWWFYGRNKNE